MRTTSPAVPGGSHRLKRTNAQLLNSVVAQLAWRFGEDRSGDLLGRRLLVSPTLLLGARLCGTDKAAKLFQSVLPRVRHLSSVCSMNLNMKAFIFNALVIGMTPAYLGE